MPAVDPYSLCPCGSGEKYKWCCQKAESYLERAYRLTESGQIDPAIDALNEGLRKHPDNAWLALRKALLISSKGDLAGARAIAQAIINRQPRHSGAHNFLVRIAIQGEGPLAAAAQLQKSLAVTPVGLRKDLVPLLSVIGVYLARDRHYSAALKHLELAEATAVAEQAPAMDESPTEMVLQDPQVPAAVKQPQVLLPAPQGLRAELQARFEEALSQANEGRWAEAAEAFEALAKAGAGPVARRNQGFCRVWLADSRGGCAAVREYIATLGETEEAVDLEALCQGLDEEDPDNLLPRVQLIWPLRNRDGLLAALRTSAEVCEIGPGPIDSHDEDSPEVEQFVLIDRPMPAQATDLTLEQVPRVQAEILVGQEIAALEAYDDERLSAFSDRFTTLAGSNIPPAHPRSKALGHFTPQTRALVEQFAPIPGLSEADAERLSLESRQYATLEIWPNTRLPFFNGRTPTEAAKAGNATVALRAALLALELRDNAITLPAKIAELRSRLNVPPEPEIDPETANTETLHVLRMHLVAPERLSDEKLIALRERARLTLQLPALRRVTRAVIDRPALFEQGVSLMTTYVDQANVAASDGDRDEALAWLHKGRAADPHKADSRHAASWDMHEIRLAARFDKPQDWVGELSIVLERYQGNSEANNVVVSHLVGMGLVRVVSKPENPEQTMLDSRPLQLLLAEYGPKVTTASGRLGVSAARGGIWTPGSETGGAAGGLWTPGAPTGAPAPAAGAGTGASPEKSRLIIPGR